ncbi:MAG: NAD(P)H-binding protein [Acidobacteria bacterium]|nr:NAD(P)H-binding protein [Acidobacteriota bacterium]
MALAAAIAGAAGLTGQQVLNRLLDDGGFDPVVAVLRRPLHRAHPRLRERVVEFSSLESVTPVRLDAAFCTLGTTIRKAGSKEAFRAVDRGYVAAFARWARANGARHFLYVSSVAAELNSANFYLRVKAETERELEGVGFEWLDIFQPSFLLGSREERRPLERIAQTMIQGIQFALTGPLERYRGIAAGAVARAMVARAKAPGGEGVRRFLWRDMMELS